MKNSLAIGQLQLTWLNGGLFELDGGTMFGVVPAVLWRRKFQSDVDGYIQHRAWPILIRTPEALVIVETGFGNKLTDKQRRNFRIRREWRILEDLRGMGLRPADIDIVILTHFDWDHAGGVVMQEPDGELSLTFPRAHHVLQRKEWDDVLSPNIRNIHTFWPINNELLRNSGIIDLVDGDREVVTGVRVSHTGGHNRGHQIVIIESDGHTAIHLADLLPTHAHFNPLWLTAYDNYPMEAIEQKQKWETFGVERNALFTFYHDPYMLACRFDGTGAVVQKWQG